MLPTKCRSIPSPNPRNIISNIGYSAELCAVHHLENLQIYTTMLMAVILVLILCRISLGGIKSVNITTREDNQDIKQADCLGLQWSTIFGAEIYWEGIGIVMICDEAH